MTQQVDITVSCEFPAELSKGHIEFLIKNSLKDEPYFIGIKDLKEEAEIYGDKLKIDEEFELQNVKDFIQKHPVEKNDYFLEGVMKAVKRDGYHVFGKKSLVLLLIGKLEKCEPDRMMASVMLREIGVLNVVRPEEWDDNTLDKVFNHCIEVILWL